MENRNNIRGASDTGKGRYSTKYLLSGLVICGDCGTNEPMGKKLSGSFADLPVGRKAQLQWAGHWKGQKLYPQSSWGAFKPGFYCRTGEFKPGLYV